MEQTVARTEKKKKSKNINVAINFFLIIYLHLWANLFIFLFVWVSGAVFNSIPIMLLGSNYTLYVICKYDNGFGCFVDVFDFFCDHVQCTTCTHLRSYSHPTML